MWTIINDGGTGFTLNSTTYVSPLLILSGDGVDEDTDLIFGLVVNDGDLDSSQDTVTITIVDSELVL